MTQLQTRQLGIEFERRVLLIDANSEYADKLDTDTIYSILSEYLNQYVLLTYLQEDQVPDNSKIGIKLADALKTLVKTAKVSVTPSDEYDVCSLPSDYFLYIRSTSLLDSTYKTKSPLSKPVRAVNTLIKENDVNKVLINHYNSNGIIRDPLVVLEENKLKVIHDNYTSISSVDLTYCRKPYNFNVLDYNDEDMSDGAVHSYCDLPFSCFDELVEGAVQLYIGNYKYYLAMAKSDRTRNSVLKAIADMAKDNN